MALRSLPLPGGYSTIFSLIIVLPLLLYKSTEVAVNFSKVCLAFRVIAIRS